MRNQDFISSISGSKDGNKAQEDVSKASNGLIPESSTAKCAKGVMETLSLKLNHHLQAPQKSTTKKVKRLLIGNTSSTSTKTTRFLFAMSPLFIIKEKREYQYKEQQCRLTEVIQAETFTFK
ncbi:hypothetical protein M5689_005883 [Euphorbia peplus]|nr:hypothetical protein M5689_005883 [Euphorbia peplus]